LERCRSGDSSAEKKSELEDLVENCTAALRGSRDNPELTVDLLIRRGVARRNLGNLKGSLADLTEAVKRDPSSARAIRMRAWTLREADRPDEAEAEYDRALKLDDHWQGYLSRCVARLDQRRYADALEDCEEALERERNQDSLFFTAWLVNRRGETKRAMALLQEGTRLRETASRIFVFLAELQRDAGDADAARRTVKDGRALFPDDAELKSLQAVIDPG